MIISVDNILQEYFFCDSHVRGYSAYWELMFAFLENSTSCKCNLAIKIHILCRNDCNQYIISTMK